MPPDPLKGAIWMFDTGPRSFDDMTAAELKEVIRSMLAEAVAARHNFRALSELRCPAKA